MQLLGQPVRHNAFGTGVITGLSGNIITIDFAQGEKRFQYPDAFSRFLTLKDAGKQNEIRAGYERRLRAERAERQKELERQERLGKIRSMKVTPYSQAAFDIPWKEAKAAAKSVEEGKSGGRSRRGIHRLLFERLLQGQAAYPQQAQAEFGVSADNSGDGL